MGRSLFGKVQKAGATASKSMLGENVSDALGVWKPKTITIYVDVPDADFIFEDALTTSLETVQKNYVVHMASKNFNLISSDIDQILTIYNQLYTLQESRKNANVILLLQIAMDSLQSSMNIYVIYTQNIELHLKNVLLEQKVDEILSGKNEMLTISDTSGQIEITKTFTLAPLFSYYIMLYGMPEFGVGFDPIKLSTIKKVLEDFGINPYS
jgi:hypothetical protein